MKLMTDRYSLNYLLYFFYFNSWIHEVQGIHLLQCWLIIKTIFLHSHSCNLERVSQKSHGTNLFCTCKLLHLQADNTSMTFCHINTLVKFSLYQNRTQTILASGKMLGKSLMDFCPCYLLPILVYLLSFACKFWVTSSQLLILYLHGITNTLLKFLFP